VACIFTIVFKGLGPSNILIKLASFVANFGSAESMNFEENFYLEA